MARLVLAGLVLVRCNSLGAAMNPVQTAALITELKRIAAALETIAKAQPKPDDPNIRRAQRPSWALLY